MTDQTAHAAPYDAGDAPVASRPLPTHDDAHHQLAAAGRQIVTLTAERDQARNDLKKLAHHRNAIAEDLAKARATIASQAEQLRRNGTLLCRVRDALEDIERAWAEHDTLGRDPAGTPEG